MTKTPRFLLLLFCVALLLRLIPVILAWNLGIGLDDMFQYDMLARSIVAGEGFRWYSQPDLALLTPYIQFDLTGYDPRGVLTTFRAPLYPGFLALVYAIFGVGTSRFIAARLVQSVICALLAPLTYLLAKEVLPNDERTARIAGWIMAGYPLLLIFPLGLVTENLFFLCLLGALLLTLITVRKANSWLAFAAGISFGLAMLTRSVIAIAIPAAALWLWFDCRQRRNAVLLLIGAVFAITPWVVRNSLIQGRLANVENSLGYNLYVSYHPDGDGSFRVGISFDLMHYLDDRVRDEAGMTAFRQFVADDPARAVGLAFSRLGYFFGLERRALTYFYSNNFFGALPLPALVVAAIVFLFPFALLSISTWFGLILPWNRQIRWLILFALAYLIPHILILSEERFHLALIPFFAIFSARAWIYRKEIWNIASLKDQRWKLVTPLVLTVALVAYWTIDITADWPAIVALFSPGGNALYLAY